MYSLDGDSFMFFRNESAEITPAKLDNLQATARATLADARRGARALFVNQMIGLLFGGLTPLLASLLFGWPAFLVVVGMAIDNAMTWLGDFLKPLLAQQNFVRQWQDQCEVRDALSLARETQVLVHGSALASIPEYRAVKPEPNPVGRVTFASVALGPSLTIVPVGILFLFFETFVPEAQRAEACAMLAIPVVIRLALAIAAVVTTRDIGLLRLTLMPRWLRPALTFLYAIILYFGAGLFFWGKHGAPPELQPYEGLRFFVGYLLCALLSSLQGLAQIHGAERDLRGFVALDLEAVKQRVLEAYRARRLSQRAGVPAR